MKVLKIAVMLALVLGLAACGPQVKSPGGGGSEAAESAARAEREAIGRAIKDMGMDEAWEPAGRVSAHGATIYAVRFSLPDTGDSPYLTLDEAVAAKQVEVRERGDGGQVSQLEVLNKSGKPIFLMAGDLLLGGQQDRIVAESLVVDAGTEPVLVPVFCVESGRWHTQAKDGELAQTRTFTNTGEKGQVTNAIKAAALQSGDQGKVWQEVAQENFVFGAVVGNASNTFRASLDSGEIEKQVEAAFAEAKKSIAGKAHGYAMVVNGEVVALDVFESPVLAGKLMDKLVRGYLTSAIGMERTAVLVKAQAEGATTATITGEVNDESGSYLRTQRQDGPRTGPLSGQTATRPATATIQTASPRAGPTFFGEPVAEQTQPSLRVTNPTSTTSNRVDSDANGVKLTSEDKARGRVVHRSFLKS